MRLKYFKGFESGRENSPKFVEIFEIVRYTFIGSYNLDFY